jgi:toxin-antitoxin system PIN domain toxin
MILPDVNILLYAHNNADKRYKEAKGWLSELLAGDDPACFTHETINGFIRIVTNQRAVPFPISLANAFLVVNDWLDSPNALLLLPTKDHFQILKDLAIASNARGSLFSDAVIAALAIEHGATVATSDVDFSIFTNLKVINPLQN